MCHQMCHLLMPMTTSPHATAIPAMAPGLSEKAPPFAPVAPPFTPPLAAPTPPTREPVDSVSVMVGNEDDPVGDAVDPAVPVAASENHGRAKRMMDRICIKEGAISVERVYAIGRCVRWKRSASQKEVDLVEYRPPAER
jgi:hypothetical protein